MLTILLVALALYIFWLLFRNGPAFAERVPNKKRNWVGPTSNQKEWQGYCSEVFQPFSSQTTFYAIAYFANFVAAANAISWSIVYEGDYFRHHQSFWQLLHSQYARCLGNIWVRRTGVFHH